MRKFLGFLSLTIISATVIAIAPRRVTEKIVVTAATANGTQDSNEVSQDPPGTIDGTVTPELIPDDVAYSLFFHFVAGRGTEKKKNSLKSYMQQVQLGDIDLEALISTSEEYQQALNTLDNQESGLGRINHNNMEEIESQLNELKLRKLALVNEKVGLLPNRIGTSGAQNIRRHVMEYIKRRVKIIPGPVMATNAH